MKQTCLRRVLSVVLALIMALSSVPTASLAEMAAVREAPEQAQNSDKAGQDVSGSQAPASVASETDDGRVTTGGVAALGAKNASEADGGEPREGDSSATATPTAFVQEVSVEGTRVRVEAEPGTFPEGARLSARSVPLVQRAQAELAVDEARAGDQSVAASYTQVFRLRE